MRTFWVRPNLENTSPDLARGPMSSFFLGSLFGFVSAMEMFDGCEGSTFLSLL